MFLKRLLIHSKQGLIREISFHKGINLIVDETPQGQNQQTTGNNVGKTTVLRLVDYCFGSKGESIYKDTEFSNQPNTTIQDFLVKQEVKITIELVDDLEDADSRKVVVEKNFLSRKNKVLKINGESVQTNRFDAELKKHIFQTEVEKPTFRQIISKNIRIEKDRMDNIVKVLGAYVNNETYEALFLFWLGIDTDNAEEKIKLRDEKKREETFRRRLRKENELPLIEQKLAFYKDKIAELEARKKTFNLNKNYDKDVKQLTQVKLQMNKLSSEISQLEMRVDLIKESQEDLEQEYTNDISPNQVKSLYEKASALIPNIQVSFEETLKFHNDLISEKLNYITKELPNLEKRISAQKAELKQLRRKEVALTEKVQKSGVAEDLEKIIAELSKHFEIKGNLEEQKRLWEVSNAKMQRIEEELSLVDKDITSNDDLIRSRVTQFNKYFTKMSDVLYGENYILTPTQKDAGYDLIVTNIEGNPSTGKKKGQIAAFDFAYIQFADNLDVNCLHFIMHDQLENIHDNQLNTMIEVANDINGQYIVSILRDKIPENVDVTKFEVLSLSQEHKLFGV